VYWDRQDVLTQWGSLRKLLADFEPTLYWHRHYATQRQLDVLKRLGVPSDCGLLKGEASYLLNQISLVRATLNRLL